MRRQPPKLPYSAEAVPAPADDSPAEVFTSARNKPTEDSLDPMIRVEASPDCFDAPPNSGELPDKLQDESQHGGESVAFLAAAPDAGCPEDKLSPGNDLHRASSLASSSETKSIDSKSSEGKDLAQSQFEKPEPVSDPPKEIHSPKSSAAASVPPLSARSMLVQLPDGHPPIQVTIEEFPPKAAPTEAKLMDSAVTEESRHAQGEPSPRAAAESKSRDCKPSDCGDLEQPELAKPMPDLCEIARAQLERPTPREYTLREDTIRKDTLADLDYQAHLAKPTPREDTMREDTMIEDTMADLDYQAHPAKPPPREDTIWEDTMTEDTLADLDCQAHFAKPAPREDTIREDTMIEDTMADLDYQAHPAKPPPREDTMREDTMVDLDSIGQVLGLRSALVFSAPCAQKVDSEFCAGKVLEPQKSMPLIRAPGHMLAAAEARFLVDSALMENNVPKDLEPPRKATQDSRARGEKSLISAATDTTLIDIDLCVDDAQTQDGKTLRVEKPPLGSPSWVEYFDHMGDQEQINFALEVRRSLTSTAPEVSPMPPAFLNRHNGDLEESALPVPSSRPRAPSAWSQASSESFTSGLGSAWLCELRSAMLAVARPCVCDVEAKGPDTYMENKMEVVQVQDLSVEKTDPWSSPRSGSVASEGESNGRSNCAARGSNRRYERKIPAAGTVLYDGPPTWGHEPSWI